MEFQTWIEIPIYVHFDYHPGHKPSVTLNDIEIADDIKEWILEKYKNQLDLECWENLEGTND